MSVTISPAVYPARVAHIRDFQEFFGKFPQEGGSVFLFNQYTGEAVYDVDRWGSPMPGVRKLSHWFEPTVQVQLALGEESSSERVDIGKVSAASHGPRQMSNVLLS